MVISFNVKVCVSYYNSIYVSSINDTNFIYYLMTKSSNVSNKKSDFSKMLELQPVSYIITTITTQYNYITTIITIQYNYITTTITTQYNYITTTITTQYNYYYSTIQLHYYY